MHLRKILFWPFSLPYGLALQARHWLYDRGLLPSFESKVPTIVIGNLALGGTGKTPHVELVLRALKNVSPITTLSRGYGRRSAGFREVEVGDDPAMSGDEPLQLKRKFPSARVFVGADRVAAIGKIQELVPDLKVVVLDDAFQHRRLKGGLNILLTTFHRPWHKDALLPAGRLRDLPKHRERADIVIVTKCQGSPSAEEQQNWRKDLGLRSDQQLFFSGIEYEQFPGKETQNVLLVTGIADPRPLVWHLQERCLKLEHISFPDHHAFTDSDLRRLAERFGKFAPGPKVLVTTEKDAVRLLPLMKSGPLSGIPLKVIGMRAVILNGHERFSAMIGQYVGKDQADSATS
jgi:tetraacyldisaccharide 4'-kinase